MGHSEIDNFHLTLSTMEAQAEATAIVVDEEQRFLKLARPGRTIAQTKLVFEAVAAAHHDLAPHIEAGLCGRRDGLHTVPPVKGHGLAVERVALVAQASLRVGYLVA